MALKRQDYFLVVGIYVSPDLEMESNQLLHLIRYW